VFGISSLVRTAFNIYELILFVRILMSWFRPNPYHPLVRFILQVTDPVLEPARRAIPPIGGFDFSPILVFIVLQWGRNIILSLLYGLGL
jgi:YggT family protein